MKNFKIEDRLNIWDSKIRGVVMMEDDSGHIIFKKDNMIVENGRNYIKTLVYDKITGTTSETRKIDTIKFGTGSRLTVSDDAALESDIEDYTLALNDTGWFRKSINVAHTVTFGASNPETVVVGSYFFNTTSGILKLGTTGSPNTWANVTSIVEGELVYDDTKTNVRRYNGTSWVVLGVGIAFPGTPATGTYFYRTDLQGLYLFDTVFSSSNLIEEVALKFEAIIQGKDSSSEMISELGLFLDKTDIFSRVVFEPVPVNNTITYKLTYYIYF